jgi:hypothetical protein
MSLLLTLLFACSDKTSEAPSEAPPVVAKPAAQEAPNAKAPEPVKPAPEAKPETLAKSAKFDPLAGKTLSEICLSDGLSLIKWSFADRQSNKNELCCGPDGLSEDDMECMLDWPSSDVPSCSMYDEMRNEIFARYGRSFKTDKWKEHFGAQDWYQIREDYTDDWLSPVAQANVKSLIEKKANKVGCMD